ncbi:MULTISPECIES: 23S rRNA (cytidine(2498)-2'-O)-methyltransferase RlmM [unclassified Pseudoxanthomonas]|uniref:23S rRNA (cytidine(2498)-2'-O)-methyltransferase RlmM n=1 Tax=unclassified Pseudoxanthomonas TaxID=2645906 RepID=UPI0016081708|nr:MULTISPECIES: 23S rRNA (cytidine(2498)-2'-O)-methyltransferase RlmM [unclassified Pseudoxanthomonas]MBB3275358.1 23S rRNA (cytidine2498-2'-O)-methyltransferase [Pseudoxanthomonas sp. OG2]MBD9376946.1 23S rRNA (cytidine(2498)-2'-O)-methyltransferase RlmM [Pseudoxanthomonas sp. PXM04]MBV7473552.1 23S rRNA (cytidine(2498)-2'-O)-methyltransferase RlmM [Pseudoxanthomonas sp. PXM05]UBB24292.1 23S rRNA (cytidine(2498)-2'-O)-methyltransferase RlmM [Pseudoxanthomonas japonensis]
MSGLLGFCRQGFEPELAAELTERAAMAGIAGYARAQRNDGYVLFASDEADALDRALPSRDLVFARQKLRVLAELRGLDPRDRISPMLAALEGQRFGDLWVEHPDSDSAKPLAGLARSFGNALRPALRKAGVLSAQDDTRLPRLHVVFVQGDHAFLARSQPRDASPWPLGIPRLKLLPDAPSRSALKLEEALLVLLDADERARLLKPGMTAADLGAAPGGWTWVLTRQHLRVTSVDNGPLRQHVLDTGLVEHLRADGFHWKPAQSLDWMVCDMVEQPRRVAERMATWFREGWCRHAIFNLKLPMKKRWDETRLCLDLFAEQASRPLTVRARQLYHDREEITVFATRHS